MESAGQAGQTAKRPHCAVSDRAESGQIGIAEVDAIRQGRPRHACLLIVKHGEVDLAVQLTARELVCEDEPKHIGCGETGGSAGTERILSRSGSDGTVLGY